jgi:hypothetical protein
MTRLLKEGPSFFLDYLLHQWLLSNFFMSSKPFLAWCGPVVLIVIALGLFVFFFDNDLMSFFAFLSLTFGVLGLLLWASEADKLLSTETAAITPVPFKKSDVSAELEARIRESSEFKIELEAKLAEIAALKSSLNRTDAVELNEAIAQLYVGFEFERGRADGEFAQVLAGLSESVDSLFTAAALIKGAPTPGERFVDQPAGSCKVFKTELTSDAALKGTIKAVRSPWVGFMANGKLKVITASNVSVYA